MTNFITIVFFSFFVIPTVIQCQSGTLIPLTGRMDSLDQIVYYRMITERDCVSVCLQSKSPSCYAISYESFREECRMITEPVPSLYIPNQSLLNWRSYIRLSDS